MGVRTTEHVKLSVEHADVAVMCLGLDATIEGEQGDAGNEYASGDKLGLNLPGLQEELLETVAAMGKPVVVLLMAGSAIDLPWAEHNPNVKAIVDCWYPGARGGKVIAEMLFGEFSPSGKLPVRFYHGTENLPVWNIRDDYERREDMSAMRRKNRELRRSSQSAKSHGAVSNAHGTVFLIPSFPDSPFR